MFRNGIGKKWGIVACSAVLAFVAAACGGSGAAEKETKAATPVEDTKPVQLTVWLNSSGYTHERFMETFGNFIVKKYPNVSFQVLSSDKGTTLPELVAAGAQLDLMQSSSPNVILDNGMESDLTDLIQTHKFDLNQFDPAVLEAMKLLGNGKIYGFPNGIATVALFYNKDLFDKFGVSYPTNGMTWDQVYELAQKMTRNEGGVQYLGFSELLNYLASGNQMSQGYIDPKTGKATLNNDNWRKFVDNFARFHRIPGNEYLASPVNAWQKEQRVALYASQFGAAAMTGMTTANINWGVVSLPEMAGYPGIGPGVQIPLFYLSKTSKNRDWAFKVASFLGSAEFQREAAAKVGSISAMRDRSVMNDYAKDVPTIPVAKKAAEAVPKTFAKPFPVTVYDSYVTKELVTAFGEVATGAKDTNTALREAEERANKAIEAAKVK